MKPINTTKEIHQGGKWELRLKLTQATRDTFQRLKNSLEARHGKHYSEARAFELIMEEVSALLRMTP
jgi:hypothetical protein